MPVRLYKEQLCSASYLPERHRLEAKKEGRGPIYVRQMHDKSMTNGWDVESTCACQKSKPHSKYGRSVPHNGEAKVFSARSMMRSNRQTVRDATSQQPFVLEYDHIWRYIQRKGLLLYRVMTIPIQSSLRWPARLIWLDYCRDVRLHPTFAQLICALNSCRT